MPERIVIVGAGQTAVQVIETLRRRGFAGQLTLIGEEPWLPYQRPPLSKQYLAGAMDSERLLLRPPSYYGERTVELRLGHSVEEIARRDQRLRLSDGSVLPYDALVLATGSRPRKLATAGSTLSGVHYLRTIADAARIRTALENSRRLVVIGGGYIGLEVAATARARGLEVTVLEMADRLMSRVTGPEVSSCCAAEHRRQGVRIECQTRVSALMGDHGHVRAVVTEDGAEFPADIVLVGIGALPADELARNAGLECLNGVTVDAHCRTSDPQIFAAGDCTNHPSPHYGYRLRLESVDNAFEQGASAALNLLGMPAIHDKVPWFWSDQYEMKLIIIGISDGHDTRIVRGTVSSGSFSVCYLRQGELIALDSMNNPKEQIAARKLIAARIRPSLDKLTDATLPLRDLS